MTGQGVEEYRADAGPGAEVEWEGYAVELDVPLTGIKGMRWHAVRYLHRGPTDAEYGESICGRQVMVARRWGLFDPDRYPERTCAQCAWTDAIRAGTLAGRYRHLAAGGGAASLLAVQVAQAIVAARIDPDADDEPGQDVEPDEAGLAYTVVLLAAVSAHAPTALVAFDCAQGDCEHQAECPPVAIACLACSLQIERLVDEPECLPECTIAAPCEVLRTLATHYGVIRDGVTGGGITGGAR